jgi:hypothetical protein
MHKFFSYNAHFELISWGNEWDYMREITWIFFWVLPGTKMNFDFLQGCFGGICESNEIQASQRVCQDLPNYVRLITERPAGMLVTLVYCTYIFHRDIYFVT